MRLVSLLSILGACSAAADPLATALLDAERSLGAHARISSLRSAESDTAERLDAQLKLLELHVADSKLPDTQRYKAEAVLRLLQAVRDQPRTLDGQPELPHPTIAVGAAGRSCAQALPLDQGHSRRVAIAAGESLWFRVQLPDAVNLGLSSRGSSVDAALSVVADCRTADQPPVATADDNFGLQADLVVPAARQSFWYVRYDNLSPVGGEAVLRATTSGILSGTVRTPEGEPLPGVQPRVNLYRRDQGFWTLQSSATVDAGSFSLPVTQAGIYAARTERRAATPFIDQAYDGIECAGASASLADCGTGTVTEIPLDGLSSRQIAFRLNRGIAVTGTVRDPRGQPLAGARVELRMGSLPASSALTDALGRYRLDGNPEGIARLMASATQHRSVMFDNLPCIGPCNFPAAASPLSLTRGASVNVNFVLPPAPSIAVTVSLSNDQLANFDTALQLALLRPDGSLVLEQPLTRNTPRVVFDNLLPGDYLLRLRSPNTIPRLYPDVECESDCVAELPLAPRIVVPETTETLELAFQARRYPMIFGTLRDAQSGLPIHGPSTTSQVEVLRLDSGVLQLFWVNAAGNYFMRGVAPGTHVLRARSQLHLPRVLGGSTCSLPLPQCTEFTPVVISRDDPDRRIDFALTPLGQLIVTANNTGLSLPSLAALSSGGGVTAEFSLPSGTLQSQVVNGVPLGTQIIGLRAFNVLGQLHDRVDCSGAGDYAFIGCPFFLATPLLIQPGQPQAVSFALRPEKARRVIVRSAENGSPLAGVALDLWTDTGLRSGSVLTGPDGSAWLSRHPLVIVQNFALSTDNRQGYVDQVHAGISCPNGSAFLGLCSLSGATLLSLPAPNNVQPTIEILLQRETPLFRNGFEPAN